MTPDVSPPPVEALLAGIEQGRRDDVVGLVRATARESGLDAAIRLLVAAQIVTGTRWQANQWSVAAEHAATAIVDLALTAAALDVAPATPRPGTVVVACAEEEWHVLPARMLSEHLRADGWDVTFLGASTPADHLADFLTHIRPTAVALSCSVPLFLPGAARSIAACHSAGTPVVAGGAAFGVTPRRAAALGADAWAVTATEAAGVVGSWLASPPALRTPGVDDRAQLSVAVERPQVVEAAMPALALHLPPHARAREHLAWVREHLDSSMRSVEAALRTDDGSVVTEFTAWLSSVITSHGYPQEIVPMSMEALHDGLAATSTDARRLLAIAADAARS